MGGFSGKLLSPSCSHAARRPCRGHRGLACRSTPWPPWRLRTRPRRPGRSTAPISPLLSRFPSLLSPAAELHHCRRCRLSPSPLGSSPSRSMWGSRSAVTFSSFPHKESGRGRSSRRRHPLLLPRRTVAVEDAIVTVRSFPPSPRTLMQSRVSSASFWLSPAPPPPLLVAVTVRRRRRRCSGAPGLAPVLGRPGPAGRPAASAACPAWSRPGPAIRPAGSDGGPAWCRPPQAPARPGTGLGRPVGRPKQ